jgi:hypothetical protein
MSVAIPPPPRLYALVAYTGTHFRLLYFLTQQEKHVRNKMIPITLPM